MINFAKTGREIELLLDTDDVQQLRYAALECRLAIEEICYARLRLAHAYLPFQKIRTWQAAKLLKFLFQEVEPALQGGATFSISREPVEKIGELSREEYEALEFVDLGSQAKLSIKNIKKLYYKISKHLHAGFPPETPSPRDVNLEEIKQDIQAAVDEISTISQGTLEFFMPAVVVRFQCVCGEEIARTEYSLRNSHVVRCQGSQCEVSYFPTETESGFELCRRIASVDCPHCNHKIMQEHSTLEKLSIFNEYETECPNCKGGIKMTPKFEVNRS